MNTLASLLPDFAIIALGALIGLRISEKGWQQIDALSYFLLYPALLFHAASQRPIEPRALLVIGLLACALVSIGFVLTLLAARLYPDAHRATRAGISQNAWRFNTALGFVAVAALPPEAPGVLAIIVGVAIPVANLYAVTALTNGNLQSRTALLREIASNPFLLASLAGVLVGLSGRALPDLVDAFVSRLADAAIPIVMLSLGAALRQSRLWPPDAYSVAIATIKLLVLPTLVTLVALATGATGVLPATFLIFAALPTASGAHVLAARYGADRGRVAVTVMQSSALGILTLPLWTSVAVRLAAP